MGEPATEKKSQTANSLTQGQSQLTPGLNLGGTLSDIIRRATSGNTDLTGNESGALDSLVRQGQAGNPNQGQLDTIASSLLSGGPDRSGYATDALADYKRQLSPTANGALLDPGSNPALRSYLDTARTDASKSVNDRFAAAGRDFSGSHAMALGRGIEAAEAPIAYGAYDAERNRQLGAAGSLFSAGSGTSSLLSGLDQNRLQTILGGVGVSSAARDSAAQGPMQVLSAEAARRGIPVEALAAQLGIAMPAAATFGNQTSSQSGQSQTDSTATKTVPLSQQIIGGGIATAGLLGSGGTSSILGGIGSNLFGKATNGFMSKGLGYA